MKAAVWHKAEDRRVEDRPEPSPGGGHPHRGAPTCLAPVRAELVEARL